MGNKLAWVAAGAVAVWWLWPSSGARVAPSPQAAVLADGFAVIEGGVRIVELDERGERRLELATKLPPDTHVVGMAAGTGVVFRDGKRIVASRIDSDGELDHPEKFGRSVHKMCEQTASNAHRFGVLWTEANGELWFVHGPTQRLEAVQVPAVTGDSDDVRQPSWCGIASAEQRLALLWRDGNATYLTACTQKRCDQAQRVRFEKQALVGFGCVKDACGIVTRDGTTLSVSWVALRNGKIEWTRPLPSAADDARANVVGAGSRIAIAYGVEPEPVVRVVGRDGAMQAVWQARADGVPALAWSGTALLVAARRDGELTTTVIAP